MGQMGRRCSQVMMGRRWQNVGWVIGGRWVRRVGLICRIGSVGRVSRVRYIRRVGRRTWVTPSVRIVSATARLKR